MFIWEIISPSCGEHSIHDGVPLIMGPLDENVPFKTNKNQPSETNKELIMDMLWSQRREKYMPYWVHQSKSQHRLHQSQNRPAVLWGTSSTYSPTTFDLHHHSEGSAHKWIKDFKQTLGSSDLIPICMTKIIMIKSWLLSQSVAWVDLCSASGFSHQTDSAHSREDARSAAPWSI